MARSALLSAVAVLVSSAPDAATLSSTLRVAPADGGTVRDAGRIVMMIDVPFWGGWWW